MQYQVWHDRTSFSIEPKDNGKKVINEIKQYGNSRMITAIEAMYRLYAFKLYSMSPPVLQMQVHLEGMHMVAYKSTANLNNVVRSEKSQRSHAYRVFQSEQIEPCSSPISL